MTVQLVLQFVTAEEEDSYDKLIRFEESLIALPGKRAVVGGHDFGCGEMNIFLLTRDPKQTFALVQQADASQWPSSQMRVAYRLLDEETYTCLWPPEMDQFEVA